MRHTRLPARVREEHSETAWTTDLALRFIAEQGEAPWVLYLSYVKPRWPYVAPAPWHAMLAAADALAVQRHPAERGDRAHPVLRAFQDEEVSRSFQGDACIADFRPTYMGLIAQLDAQLRRLWALLDRMAAGATRS